jgi:periplasmic protein TonB
MSWPRSVALFLSLALHLGGIYALFEKSRTFALQDGKGADDLTVVAIVTLADPDQFGLAPQPQQAREAAAAIAPSQSKPESPKPVEEKATEAIAKEIPKQAKPIEPLPQKPEETAEPKTQKPIKQAEPPPVQPAPPVQTVPQNQLAQNASAASDAQEEQEAANRALEGRRIKLVSLYQGEIFAALVRHRVNPHSGRSGRVVVFATIGPSGRLVSRQVVQSSGFDVLDKAALASFDRSAPFPAIPRELGETPLTLRVPFDYSTR